MKLAVLCLLALSCGIVDHVQASVGSYDIPLELKQCFGMMKKKCNLGRQVGGSVPAYCHNLYGWVHQTEMNIAVNVTLPARNYVNRYAQQTIRRIRVAKGRRKRQAQNPAQGNANPGKGRKRIRKEIRMMSERELRLFFEAVNALRLNTTSEIQPNKYEAIAQFHTGTTSISAHGGCNFHGWHRMYLSTFENALRDEHPRFTHIAVPYWDSTLEARMEGDPTESALFSDRLYGSCQGPVKGGIMTKDGWNTTIAGQIMRNCGTDGPLMTDAVIRNITSMTQLGEICGEDSLIENDLEYHHNGGHRFADGHMASLATAVFDPIFWAHHAFIDLIWELFRENQVRNGVDPSTNYPLKPVVMGAADMHSPDADIGFGDAKVIDALSMHFTRDIYEYAPRPTCLPGEEDCGKSKYIKCVTRSPDEAVCVARTLEEVIEWEEDHKPKPKPCPDPKPNLTTPPPVHPPTPDNNTDSKPTKPIGVIKPYQNNYCMNGKYDSSQWVYIPVKIIFRRPPEYKDYGSYPVSKGRLQKQNDIYAPRAYSNVYRYLRPTTEAPAGFDNCLTPDQPTNTIYIHSVGINYAGVYKEFAIVDRRLAVTVSTAYVAVKNPINGQSVAMLHAQDTCGRVCKPICKVPGTQIFRPCSGAISVTTSFPRQFGNTFGEAVLDVWDFTSEKSCPQLQTENIVISFYCDYKTDWIWPSADPVSKPTLYVAPVHKPTPPQTIVKPKPKNPVVKPVLGSKCRLNKDCVIRKACDSSCKHGQTIRCVNSCSTYARCQTNTWYTVSCARGQRVRRPSRGCVRGLCKKRKMRKPKRKPKRFGKRKKNAKSKKRTKKVGKRPKGWL